MIQIQDKNIVNSVYFPKNTNIEGDLTLILHSELTQKDYTFDVVDASNTSNYYKFNINFKSVENGEYTYFINDIDSGLIRIGNVDESTPSTSTYIDGIEVIQYYPQDKKIDNRNYLRFEIISGGTIMLNKDTTSAINIEYRINKDNWVESSFNNTPINVNKGDIIEFRGNNNTYRNYHILLTDGLYCNVKGNIMSLINVEDFENLKSLTSVNENTFYALFKDSDGLIDASELELPATTLTQGCYFYMFRNCKSLTAAPSILPATTLEYSCYANMFNGCKSLVQAPELPAINLATGCYEQMFLGCTSLTAAPTLPATTLAQTCYRSMFSSCSSLKTAPDLNALILANNCYYGMFGNCASLNYIKCLATDISASNCTNGWIYGVSSTGTFIKNASMTGWTTGTSGIPNGWIVKNN